MTRARVEAGETKTGPTGLMGPVFQTWAFSFRREPYPAFPYTSTSM